MFYDELVFLDKLNEIREERELARPDRKPDPNTALLEMLIDEGAGVDAYGNVYIASTLDPARIWRYLP